MPRYYFHLCNGSCRVIHDATGQECADDEAARQVAQQGAGFLRPGLLSAPARYRLTVVNEAGEAVFTLPLSKVLARCETALLQPL